MSLHDPEGPWNPGIGSELSRPLLEAATIFRAKNVFNSLAHAMEIQAITGLPLESLAIFRPERLALHEALVRVSSDYEVPDPDDASVNSLGVTLRGMTQAFVTRVIDPNRREMDAVYNQLRAELAGFINAELSATSCPPAPGRGEGPGKARGMLFWLRSVGAQASPRPESDWERDERTIHDWTERAQSAETPTHAAAMRSLARAASAIRSRNGRLPREHRVLASIALDLACNEHGAVAIGEALAPRIHETARKEGFRPLPAQGRPVAMVTKGASASGKSTMRPLQRRLAAKMDLYWGDFALISPDTWRRALLDFDNLGPLFKYAGMLTSQEVVLIDRKLDAHLVRKGESRQNSHLLIDRFRFDSFALDSVEARNLPSRYGHLLCYFFMITPPQATIERAWKRGLEIGRYKAVDDLLAHNVEAFTGMQSILLGRVLDPKVHIHYEFLDNDVPRGEAPLTVAFGWSGEINILDVKRMLDMERYRKLNVEAKSPDELFPNRSVLDPEWNCGFLIQCVRKFPEVRLADRDSGRIYAQFVQGRLQWADPEALARAAADPEVKAALKTVAAELFSGSAALASSPAYLEPDRFHTIGRWALARIQATSTRAAAL